MKSIILRAVVACGFTFVAAVASADGYREAWTCKVKDGKEMEDVQAANSKWLAFVRDNVDKGIESAVLTAVVGNQEGFIFVDSYPSLEAWAAAKKVLDSEAGDGLDEMFEGLIECSENRLWKHESTE